MVDDGVCQLDVRYVSTIYLSFLAELKKGHFIDNNSNVNALFKTIVSEAYPPSSQAYPPPLPLHHVNRQKDLYYKRYCEKDYLLTVK